MISQLKNSIRENGVNILGWRTKRRILIIESDDWGSIRMQSKESFDALKAKGYPVDECGYNTNDSLENNRDLELLFETIESIKNSDGQSPIFTANNIVGNPDFDKIRASGFKEYYFESFAKTLQRYPSSDRVIDLYKEGILRGIFIPQFHGREHVNIPRWLHALQTGDTPSLDAFEHQMFSVHASKHPQFPMEFMDALECQNEEHLKKQEVILREGLELFESLWGFRSETFIAPCFSWHRKLNKVLAEEGIIGLQGMYYQNEPIFDSQKKYRTVYHYMGQKNTLGQNYMLRNVIFEPALNKNRDWVKTAMHEIDVAFKWNKPAIISSHRVNYTGSLVEQNRTNNLLYLKQLLTGIIRKYPDIEFMSSNMLVKEIQANSKN